MIEKLDALKMLAGSPETTKPYLEIIAADTDDYVSAGALCKLLDMNLLDFQQTDLLASHLHIPCVRRRAVFYFLAKGESQIAVRAFEEEKKAKPYNHVKHLQFAIDRDMTNLVESEAALFLETGQVIHLFNATSLALDYCGESDTLAWLIRSTLVAPMRPDSIAQLLAHLNQMDNMFELEKLTDNLIAWNIQPVLARIYSARVLLHKGNLTAFNNVIRSVPVDRLNSALKSKVYALIAKAREKEGKFREACKYFFQQNNPDRADNKERKAIFINKVNAFETLQFVGSPPSSPSNHFTMLGFPRSGTTLLENALMCHPQIETFEEIPAFVPIEAALREQFSKPADKRVVNSETWRTASAAYYNEIQRYRIKKGASVFVDKMPIRTAYAGFLSKFFPDQRYIFSIRHPYDVVLSCYKQYFLDTPTMEHFKRFEDACAIYHFVMGRWFKYFSMDDPRVCYIKYDTLVEEFQCEIARALEFLGVQWNEDVMDFAVKAQQRPAYTPSYSKVRKGLELGVQSSWENYRFLFNSANRKYLDPWVEIFGYEGI